MKKTILLLCTLMMVFGFTFTSYASEVPDGYYSYNGTVLGQLPSTLEYKNVIITHPNDYYFITNTDADYFYDRGVVVFTSAGSYHRYRHDDGKWTLVHEGQVSPDPSSHVIANEVLWSNITIRDANGYVWLDGDENFLPLAEKVLKVTEGTLTETTMPAVTEIMVLLMACGVGLMALLMALPLLKNKFSHFLP